MTHHQALEFIRQQIADEFALVNGRIASFATSQSFLITAFSLSIGNAAVYRAGWLGQVLLPALGASLCVAVMPGLRGATCTIDQWRQRQHDLLADPTALDALRAVVIARFMTPPASDRLHRRSLWFSRLLPVVLLAFWVCSFTLLRFAPIIHAG